MNFLYFALVLVFSMFFMHPVYLAISLLCSAVYSVKLCGGEGLRAQMKFILPMTLLIALINPAFSHAGVTILAYLPSGNPLTLESIVYGVAAAAMLAAVIIWFSCFNAVMTTDKFVYLFGRVIPAMSLVLSMTFRLVPRFKARFREVNNAQRCIGRDVSEGSIAERLKKAASIVSIMITWSLESSVETADSMKSRGYGLSGRTAFSIYRLDGRDKCALVWLLLCGFYIVCGWAVGGMEFNYYPTISGAQSGAFQISFMLAYLLLCLTPLILDATEDEKWKHLRSAA